MFFDNVSWTHEKADNVSWTHKKATVSLCSSYTERQRLLQSPGVILQLRLILQHSLPQLIPDNEQTCRTTGTTPFLCEILAFLRVGVNTFVSVTTKIPVAIVRLSFFAEYFIDLAQITNVAVISWPFRYSEQAVWPEIVPG